MSRHVLILTLAYPPSASVGAFRAARFARYLPQTGWTPIVVAGDVAASAVGCDDSRLAWSDRRAVVVRANPWRLPLGWKRLWRSARNAAMADQAVGRAETNIVPPTFRARCRSAALNAAWAAASPFRIPDRHIWWAVPALAAMRRVVREYRPSVVLSSSPPHSSHLIALALKAMTGIPVVIDLRDPWARNRADGGGGRMTDAIQSRLERFCVSRADRVVLNTAELLTDFERQYPAAWHDRFSVIPNGYDPLMHESIKALVRSRGARTPGAALRLCHAGTVYGRRDIRPLIEAVALLNRQGHNVTFEQVGLLANAGDVAACVARNDAGRAVQLLGQRSHQEALERLAAADVLVVVRQNTGMQIPAKIYELMLFGKPILALDDAGAVTRMIDQYQLGVVADPVDPAAIAAGILRAAEQISTPPSAGREQALRRFNARTQTRELAEVLDAAVQSNRRLRR